MCSLSTHEINPIIGSWYVDVEFLKLKRNSALALSFVRQDGRRAERRIAPITRYLVFEEATSYVHTNVKTTTLTTLASFTYLENTRRKFLLSFLLWDLFYNNLHAYSKKFSCRDFVILLATVVEGKLHEWMESFSICYALGTTYYLIFVTFLCTKIFLFVSITFETKNVVKRGVTSLSAAISTWESCEFRFSWYHLFYLATTAKKFSKDHRECVNGD